MSTDVNNGLINEVELRKAIEQLCPSNRLFEVRILKDKNKPLSGYFREADTLLKELSKVDLRHSNVYITLNLLDGSLFSRNQSEHFVSGANSTNDTEVKKYNWLFIDMDPIRPTGISSSQEELQAAFDLAKRVMKYMSDLGFMEPVKAVSGNGAHLLYRINLQNSNENKELVERCLKALSMMFDNEQVQVDTANFNPSRICKLYGTMAQKGSDTTERPYRMSKIIGEVKDVKVNDRAYLEKLASMLPVEEPQKPSYRNNYGAKEFNAEEWLQKHGLRYKQSEYKGGVKYILNECPFNSNHKAPDSMVTVSSSGAIGFKCLHNSCSEKRWRDLRLMYEPDAYDRNSGDQRIDEGWQQHNRNKTNEQAQRWEENLVTPTAPMFLTAQMIAEIEEPEGEYIQTGIKVIDRKMKGLQKGGISVISGLRGAAKSTVVSQLILNCVDNQQTTICYSGELGKKKFMNWMYLQAAGKRHTKKYDRYDGYYCPDDVKPAIAKWMAEYMWLYNNDYGNDFARIGNLLQKKIDETHADLCIIDNLMALDLTEFDSRDKNDAQTKFVWKLKDIAQKCNVHIIFVAHPRKADGYLRLNDISGSGNISNVVDNAFIVHRNNEDFKRMTEQMFRWKAENEAYQGTNVIEICKDREGGTQDCFIPLWYEEETKRLKNSKDENIVYGWDQTEDEFIEPTEEEQEEIPFL